MHRVLPHNLEPSTQNHDVLTTVGGKVAWAPIPAQVSGDGLGDGDWVAFDLSSAIFYGTPAWGQYDGTGIVKSSGWPDFAFEGIKFTPANTYEFEVTYDPTWSGDAGGRSLWIYAMSGIDPADYSASPFHQLNTTTSGGDVWRFQVGPGIGAFDTEMAAERFFPLFESDRNGRLIGLRCRNLTLAAARLSYREVVMESGVTPPTPILNSEGTDWVYGWSE